MTSLYNDHLRGPMTLTPIAENFAVELSLPVLRLKSVAAVEHPTFRLRCERTNPLHHHRGPFLVNLSKIND